MQPVTWVSNLEGVTRDRASRRCTSAKRAIRIYEHSWCRLPTTTWTLLSKADALSKLGFTASSQDTGGGIACVVLEHKEGGEIVWGTADVNWGASISDADGEYVSSIETTCPSDTQDVTAIVEAIKGPSLSNGAVYPL